MAAKVFWLASFLATATLCFAGLPAEAEGEAGGPTPSTRATEAATAEEPLPRGAIARMGTTRFRPGEDNQAVSFLPGNRTVVVMKSDGRLQHWDAQTGRFLKNAAFLEPEISAAAYTADGRFFALLGWSADQKLRKHVKWVALVDAQTGEEQMHHKFDDDPDVRLIAVADNATAIALQGKVSILIDLARGDVIEWPIEQVPYTSAVALSPDGNLLAVASPGVVRVWKWRESMEPRYFAIPGNDPRKRADIGSIEFLPDGSQMAVGIHGETVSLINLAEGKETRRFVVDNGNQRRAQDLSQLVFSADGRLLASPYSSASGSGVAVWEVATGKLVKQLKPEYDGVGPIAFSSDANWLVGIRNFRLFVWNVKTGELLGHNLRDHKTPPHTIRFSPDDESLLSAGDDGTVHHWKLPESMPKFVTKHQAESNGNVHAIRGLDVSSDGKYIATSCIDDTVRLWDAESGREIYKWPGHGRLGFQRFLRFTPDGKRLVSWGDNMQVRIWSTEKGTVVSEYVAQPSGEASSTNGGPLGQLDGKGEFTAVQGTISPDASRLVAVGKAVHVFDVATGRELLKFDWPTKTHVRYTAISPDNRFLLMLVWGYREEIALAGGKTWREVIPRAELRNLSDGTLVAEIEREDHSFTEGAAFSADNGLVAFTVGKEQRSVVVMKMPDLTEIGRIEGFSVAPFAIEFSHSGKLLAVAKEDTSVVVYNLAKLTTEKTAQP
ncbi:MAG: WD40 repeat domain-containing protein [Pirellulales bacterium]